MGTGGVARGCPHQSVSGGFRCWAAHRLFGIRSRRSLGTTCGVRSRGSKGTYCRNELCCYGCWFWAAHPSFGTQSAEFGYNLWCKEQRIKGYLLLQVVVLLWLSVSGRTPLVWYPIMAEFRQHLRHRSFSCCYWCYIYQCPCGALWTVRWPTYLPGHWGDWCTTVPESGDRAVATCCCCSLRCHGCCRCCRPSHGPLCLRPPFPRESVIQCPADCGTAYLPA